MKQVTKGDKLTIITVNDLTAGYKVVQSAHALADFAINHEQEFKNWQCNSNYLCCLETSRYKLGRLIDYLELLKIKYNIFMEPDIGDLITAVAVESLTLTEHKKIFKNFKLTLS